MKNQEDDGPEAFCKWTALEPEKRLCSLHEECIAASSAAAFEQRHSK